MVQVFLNKIIRIYLFVVKSIRVKSKHVNVKARIGSHSIIMEGSVIDAMSELGKYVYVGKYTYITKAKIGNYCSIANNVSIGQGEHELDKLSTSSLFYDDAYKTLTQKECIIENDVWIGVDSIIKRGVRIGNGAVIGANSVVTKDVPNFAIVAGVPAKIIRYRFEDNMAKMICESKWWTYDLEQAKEIHKELRDNG